MTTSARELTARPDPGRRGPDLRVIEQAALRAERRIRLGRALAAGTTSLCVALLVAAVALALRKTHTISEWTARGALVFAVAQLVAVTLAAYARRLPRRAGAVALDRFHALSDRLSSALSFGELPDDARTPFMDAAIDDALGAARHVDPRRAVPLRRPRDLPAAGVLALAALAIGLFEVREHVTVASQKTIDAVDVTADDLDAMREFLRDMEQKSQSDEARAATQEFNQLIEDLAAKRLDRTEAFRKMQALEDKLLEGREADAKALEEALKKIGEELKKAELTKPAGEALDTKNLVDAEKQMRDLAKKLKEGEGKLDKAQLEKTREALKKAGEEQERRMQEIAKRREELKQQLLQQRQKTGDAGAQQEQEKSLLQKRERELDRLDREQQQQEAAQRQLDRLDRDLQKAAEDLMRDMGLSAKDLEQGAEDINRMSKEEMSQEEKEQLRQKLDELREMMRQQGQGGQQQMVRLRRFQQRAHGQSGQGGGQGQQGQGQGEEQEGQEGQNGQNGQGQQGQNGQGQGQQGQGQRGQQGQAQNGQGQGQGQQGQGQGQGGQNGETWILGPGGQKIMVLSMGQGRGQNGQGGQGQGNQPGSHGWGTGHDAHVQGGATNPNMGTEDTQVAGADTGQGGSRSEVIRGAAEKGFASRGYQKVYREYHPVAEEALNRDDIPGGYRFYVRRYFQLIRPRDEQGGPAPAGGAAP